MKKNKFKANTSILSVACILIAIMVLVTSCSQKISFQTSSVVPAAEGSIKLKKDKNKNYRIELNVMRLADSKRLNPGRSMYVVWMDTQSNGTKNLGQLKTSSSLLSSTLKSSLNAVTAYKPVKIFITAEDNADITFASGERVLETGTF